MSKKTPIVCLVIGCAALSFAVFAAPGAETPGVVAEAAAADQAAEASPPEVEGIPDLDSWLAELGGPEATPLFGCPETGGCDTDLDCFRRDYYCPSGSPKACFESSGTGSCDGWCGCCP
jgi:hypothetical protein